MDYRELLNLGISEKEAKVYLASLELGKDVVQNISAKAGVNRATTYVVIENLTKKGLIKSFTEDKRQLYRAESPGKLSLLFREQAMAIQRKQESLDKIMPELKIIDNSNKNKPVIRYFEGLKGIQIMIEELLKEAKDNGIINMACSFDLLEKNFTNEKIKYWRKKRAKENIESKIIYTYKNGVFSNGKNDSRKIPIEKFPIKSDIAICGRKIRISSLQDRQIGILIEDEEIANTLKAILDLAWEGAEKYHKKYEKKNN